MIRWDNLAWADGSEAQLAFVFGDPERTWQCGIDHSWFGLSSPQTWKIGLGRQDAMAMALSDIITTQLGTRNLMRCVIAVVPISVSN